MKKTVLLALCLTLALGCAICPAETADEIEPAFEIIAVVPEGYTASPVSWADPFKGYLTLEPQTEGMPHISLFVSYNDSYSEITWNDDMPQDEFEQSIAPLVINEETGETIPYSITKTGLGTKVIHYELEGACELYTIWHGYEVSLYAYHQDGDTYTALTDEEMELVMQFLTDLDISMIISETPAA